MGPDMGMFPGGEPLFSDLAHYVRSGGLTRALVREAKADPDRAFAWGWAAHVLADAMIHPLINVAAGELRGRGPLTFADDPWAHLAVEVGVDGSGFAAWRGQGETRWPPVPRGTADLLGRAYDAVYGPAVGPGAVRRSLAAWSRWHRFSAALAGAASARLYGRPAGSHGAAGVLRRAARLLTGAVARRSPLHALTHPSAPSPRVAGLIDRAMADFPGRYFELQRGGWEAAPDYNLDTGTADPVETYPPALQSTGAARVEGTVVRLRAGVRRSTRETRVSPPDPPRLFATRSDRCGPAGVEDKPPPDSG